MGMNNTPASERTHIFLNIHTIDIILDNALLNLCTIVMFSTQHLTTMQQFV